MVREGTGAAGIFASGMLGPRCRDQRWFRERRGLPVALFAAMSLGKTHHKAFAHRGGDRPLFPSVQVIIVQMAPGEVSRETRPEFAEERTA
jgi:hypothetical protein